MALTIKNEETQRLSRNLAQLTGESITAAITTAVRERLDRVQAGQQPVDRGARIAELGQQIGESLRAASEAIDVDDLYDERGLPA